MNEDPVKFTPTWYVRIGPRNGHTRFHWFWRIMRQPITHVRKVVDYDKETGTITYDKPLKTAASTNEYFWFKEEGMNKIRHRTVKWCNQCNISLGNKPGMCCSFCGGTFMDGQIDIDHVIKEGYFPTRRIWWKPLTWFGGKWHEGTD